MCSVCECLRVYSTGRRLAPLERRVGAMPRPAACNYSIIPCHMRRAPGTPRLSLQTPSSCQCHPCQQHVARDTEKQPSEEMTVFEMIEAECSSRSTPSCNATAQI
ncbi:hypothetical protein AGOR_G00017830 [Albula goreensis]|uniref:Uncharacterized protein n=1 Tax=Albula goreensis TaxID=1534307 RepID=A0A8T3E076_9TELE|nr:hypothetical protein AGOR_G00017830 [Albula goreensis]